MGDCTPDCVPTSHRPIVPLSTFHMWGSGVIIILLLYIIIIIYNNILLSLFLQTRTTLMGRWDDGTMGRFVFHISLCKLEPP